MYVFTTLHAQPGLTYGMSDCPKAASQPSPPCRQVSLHLLGDQDAASVSILTVNTLQAFG
jgi:hypothetical protein